jgi:hypothetical protein
VGKENDEEGASGGSVLAGGEREGGVAGLVRCHVERVSGGGPARGRHPDHTVGAALSEAAALARSGGGLVNRGGPGGSGRGAGESGKERLGGDRALTCGPGWNSAGRRGSNSV